jgi:hypothetical protein
MRHDGDIACLVIKDYSTLLTGRKLVHSVRTVYSVRDTVCCVTLYSATFLYAESEKSYKL